MFQSIFSKTGLLDIACNAVLVAKNVRPSFLVQSIDYQECENGPTTLGPKTKNIIQSLEKEFKITPTYQGFIISNPFFSVPNENMLDDKIIGELIGYPCSGHLHDNTTRKFHYQIYSVYGKTESELMNVICGVNMDDWFCEKVKEIFSACKDVFPSEIFIGYKKFNIYENDDIIRKVINDVQLNDEEKNHVLNLIWNIDLNLILSLHNQKKIDIFTKKNLIVELIKFYEKYKHKKYEGNIIMLQKNIIKKYFLFIEE